MSETLESLRRLLADAEAVEQELDGLADRKEALEGDIARLQGQKGFLEQQIWDAEKQAEQSFMHSDSLSNKKRHELALLDEKCQQMSRETIQLTERKLEAQSELERFTASFEEESKRLTDELEEKQGDIANTEKLIETRRSELDILDKKLQNRRSEIEALDEGHTRVVEENETVLGNLIDTIQGKRRELEQVERQIIDAEMTIKELDAMLTTQQPALADLDKEKTKLKEAKARVDKELDAREQSLKEREKDLEKRLAESRRRSPLE